eukprot:15468867-Alexandrium_andersonii.AAC.1
MTLARSVFLAKGEARHMDIMAYRILTITSFLYRRWASIRLRHLGQWAKLWAHDCMFGSFKGKGADTAAWSLAVHVEMARAKDQATSALSVDIHKCFDQLSRELVYKLAAVGGAPMSVIRA